MSHLDERSIVVLGLMGAGKSTLAAALAARLHRPVRDSDHDIERAHGRTAATIAAEDGRDHLHALELAHLTDALTHTPPCVIAAAASVADQSSLPDLLAGAVVVRITGTPEELAARFASGAHRPVYGDTLTVLRRQAARRDPVLAAAADVVVAATAPTDAQVAAVLRAHG